MQEDKPTDFVVEDGEDYRSNTAIGLKEIAIEQYRRACLEGSKEMTRAGERRVIRNGMATIIDIPDQRQVFMNSVQILKGTLMEKILQDKETLEKLNIIDEEIKNINLVYKIRYKKIVEYDTRVQSNSSSKRLSPSNYDNLIEERDLKIVETHRKLLTTLSLLLCKLNYLGESSAEGSI